MATVGKFVKAGPARPQAITGYPADSLRFDWLSILASAWFLAGLFLDGWAHNNIAELETFFTPWHGVLYSGYFAVAGLLAFTQYRNVIKGHAFRYALPRGYWLSLVGAAIFFIGGAGDLVWHEVFGIEQNVEALFSPSHLLLATGAALYLTGPLRAAWGRRNSHGWRELAPGILSLFMIFSLLTFFVQYANIFSNPTLLIGRNSNGYFNSVTTVANLLFPAAITTGVLLLALRRWHLPFGAATLLLTGNASLMLLMRFEDNRPTWAVIIAALVAGLAADGLIAWLRPSVERPNALRLFAFVVPFVLFLGVVIAVGVTLPRGLGWPIHMWLGVPVTAGLVGLALSFLTAPPTIPNE
jgi:hypothetical protein